MWFIYFFRGTRIKYGEIIQISLTIAFWTWRWLFSRRTSTALPDERSAMCSVSGNHWGGMGGHNGSSMSSDKRSCMYYGSGEGSTMYHWAAVMTDGSWYTTNNGAAVHRWGQEARASGGNSQKSGQHHQFEHLVCRSVLYCGQTELKKTMDIKAFIYDEGECATPNVNLVWFTILRMWYLNEKMYRPSGVW